MKSSFQQDIIFTIVSACIWKCLLLKKTKQTNPEGEVLKTPAVKLDSNDLYFKIN